MSCDFLRSAVHHCPRKPVLNGQLLRGTGAGILALSFNAPAVPIISPRPRTKLALIFPRSDLEYWLASHRQQRRFADAAAEERCWAGFVTRESLGVLAQGALGYARTAADADQQSKRNA